ncbi:carboxymuconolactone decarboxylase family protein [Sphingosinicella soli]|uniref:Alkylhydroperoxidase family enzyme n=1 Tax=Sphingosinicella soli TaxID=333708 RepID=A0A7W7B3L2_9SPHN|nr:carboxymuconolactone decarboxylase family protein [Sphingosinicella soli]MBB4633386.1 alkylhydroperoxidase family enzyme [Sphingosinicella soli]
MSTLHRFEFDELPKEIGDRLAPRVTRLGYLGEFFKCAAHQPEALAAFIDFTEAGKKGLPDNLVELIALSCAVWMGNDYERNQHERLCIKLGFHREWVAAVERLKPAEEPLLGDDERSIQRLVLSMLETRGKDSGALFDEAIHRLGEAPAIAVLMVVGRYVVHALLVNSLGLAPPVPSIFAEVEA